MKTIITLILSCILLTQLSAQQQDTSEIRISENYLLKVIETNEGTQIFLGGKAMFEVRELDDSTTIQVGNKKLIVSEKQDKTFIEVLDDKTRKRKIIYDEEGGHDIYEEKAFSGQDTIAGKDTANAREPEKEDEDHDASSQKSPNRWSDFEDLEEFPFNSNDDGEFKGHWFSFDWGFNNYLGPDGSISRTEENRYMDLNTGRSWNFNINFSQYSLGLISDRAGFVTGLGIEINNYHFDDDNSITKANGEIVPSYRFDSPDIELKKNRFTTTYLTVPVLFEAQLTGGDRKDRLYVSFGVLGGVRIGNHIKVKYLEDGRKKKYKEKGDDFNLNTFRYGVTAKAGYKALSVFGRYYLTPLFEKNNGPELYPLSIGLSLNL